jgi:hypothetical protein
VYGTLTAQAVQNFFQQESIMSTTLKQVNKAVQPLGIQLNYHRGDQHYWWWGIENNQMEMKLIRSGVSTTVYVSNIGQMTLAEWIEEAVNLVEEINRLTAQAPDYIDRGNTIRLS